jgi:hypothetical protein
VDVASRHSTQLTGETRTASGLRHAYGAELCTSVWLPSLACRSDARCCRGRYADTDAKTCATPSPRAPFSYATGGRCVCGINHRPCACPPVCTCACGALVRCSCLALTGESGHSSPQSKEKAPLREQGASWEKRRLGEHRFGVREVTFGTRAVNLPNRAKCRPPLRFPQWHRP